MTSSFDMNPDDDSLDLSERYFLEKAQDEDDNFLSDDYFDDTPPPHY